MQFTTAIFTLALAATSLAAPSPRAGGPSARSAAAEVSRRWEDGKHVNVRTFAPDGTNNIYDIPVSSTYANSYFTDITHDGAHPELSISLANWDHFNEVLCEFIGVDTGKNAEGASDPVLSNIVTGPDGYPAFQVGPPQTLTAVSCWFKGY